MSAPIPVICDRCRAEGLAGEDVFEAFGALLDFDPVPRRMKRPDGWDEEVQRAYIAALSLTGSDRAASRAVGKAAFGIKQLLNSPGSEGFAAAREEAMAIAGDERSRRLAEGLRAVASDEAGWRPPDPPWSRAASRRRPAQASALAPPADSRESDVALQVLDALLKRYAIKLRQERAARVAGQIAAADFYVRQLTCIEVSLDVASRDGMDFLEQVRRGGHGLLDIAATPMSRLLDEARRRHWERCGDPPRPEPPSHLLVDHGGFETEPLEFISGAPPEERRAQVQRYEERHAADAEAHIAWEQAARADWAARRADGRITDADLDPPEQHWLDAALGLVEGEGETDG